MSFESLLIHRCSILRFVEAGTGAHGEPTGTWDELYKDVKCRVYQWGQGVESKNRIEVETGQVQFDFLPGQDITERDRIAYEGRTHEVVTVRPTFAGLSVIHHIIVYAKLVS